MHSRIYQISSQPISEENLIRESNYDENERFDYVVKSSTIEADLKWLQDTTQGLVININDKTITLTSRKEYFSKKHEQFRELLEKLQDVTLEQFSNGSLSLPIENLKGAYEDEWGFYIDDNFEYLGLTSLDNWVRNAEENKTYFIGEIFDYHM